MKKNLYKSLTILILFSINIFANDLINFSNLINKSDSIYKSIDSYTCLYSQTERLDSSLYGKKNIYMKFKKPFKIYMKFLEGDNKGSEVLFVNGKYQNKIKFHLGNSLLKYFTIDLNSDEKLKNSNHTIYDAGIGFIIDQIKLNFEIGKKYNEVQVVKFKETENFITYKLFFPKNSDLYYAHIVKISFYKDLKLPHFIKIYQDNDKLKEKFIYDSLKIDPPNISDKDFDIDNPSYNF